MTQLPPPVLAVVAVLAQKALGRAQRPTVPRVAVAGGIALASAVLAATAARQFRGRGTTLDPFDPAQASILVTTGPNAVSRNPMYTGLAGLLLANAVRRGAWTGLLPVVGFVLAMDRLQVALEEAALLERFGADYAAYRAAVPRWLGPGSLPR